MSEQNKSESESVEVIGCGVPVEAHAVINLVALIKEGMPIPCEANYRSLLEIAEGVRQHFGFRPYEPTGVTVKKALVEFEAAVKLAKETEQQVTGGASSYEGKLLSPELKMKQ